MRCVGAPGCRPRSSSSMRALARASRRRQPRWVLDGLDQLPADRVERIERWSAGPGRSRRSRGRGCGASPRTGRLSMRSPSSRISPAGDAARRLEQADDRGAGERFAGARFADHAEHLARRDVEGDVVDAPRSVPRRVGNSTRRCLDFEQRAVASPSSAQLRVQRVAQPVAEQVDRRAPASPARRPGRS